ncbi:MAG TPA: DUF3750 domain-containing protein [Gammaproteobacteria bacterium]|nr:DUF3750 domain-containing protein [Gammaproteobacteria bacterium]
MLKYVLIAAAATGVALTVASALTAEDWRTASREPVGLAPAPGETPEAVVQVYAARAVRWRGYFGVHTWIAAKPPRAEAYTVYEVNGWRLRRSGSAVVASSRPPDGRWFGNAPTVIAELRGAPAERVLDRLDAAVARYPYPDRYRVWPGPNSNTFTAHVLRELPELAADLPPTAIGKDFIGTRLTALAPSGTGYQLSLMGAAGILAAVQEGIELNVLGLTFGIDALTPALKLPMVGRVGALPVLGIALLATALLRLARRYAR